MIVRVVEMTDKKGYQLNLELNIMTDVVCSMDIVKKAAYELTV